MEKTAAHCSVGLPGYPHEVDFRAIVDKSPRAADDAVGAHGNCREQSGTTDLAVW